MNENIQKTWYSLHGGAKLMYTVWMGKKAKRFQRESDVAVYWAKWPQKIKAIYVVKKK